MEKPAICSTRTAATALTRPRSFFPDTLDPRSDFTVVQGEVERHSFDEVLFARESIAVGIARNCVATVKRCERAQRVETTRNGCNASPPGIRHALRGYALVARSRLHVRLRRSSTMSQSGYQGTTTRRQPRPQIN